MFEDRVDAGRRLAARLGRYRGTNAIVLAIPRGGVVVGYEVASSLGIPLDVVIPRKLGAPGQPELAIGAIGDGISVLNQQIVDYLRVPQRYIEAEIEQQRRELERRLTLYRGDRPFPDLRGRTAVLVDDGIATGYTTIAAARSVRARQPEKLVLAVPVAPAEGVELLRPEVDEIVVLETPEPFFAVGSWYADFGQTTDAEVIELLERGRNIRGAADVPSDV